MIRACGAIAWSSVCAVVVADLVGFMVVDPHNPISETISKLAVGRHAWIQDFGINLFGTGTALLGAGLLLWRGGGAAWRVGIVLVALLGLDLVFIAEYNQYAGELGQGATVHRALVFTMFALFAGASLLLAQGLGSAGRGWKIASLGACGAWLVLAPLLFVVPTAIDGAYERLVSLILLAWVGGVAALLIRHAPEGRAGIRARAKRWGPRLRQRSEPSSRARSTAVRDPHPTREAS